MLDNKIGLKIKQLRNIKGWTRQKMADNLEMSIAGYGSIERGETDISIKRLKQIAGIFELSLLDLLAWNENKTFNITQNNTNDCNNWQLYSSDDNIKALIQSKECEKCEIIKEAQKTEIENLKQQIIQLQDINNLLKNINNNRISEV
jgi:transcriptional regulator with XRE-family HTH domain